MRHDQDQDLTGSGRTGEIPGRQRPAAEAGKTRPEARGADGPAGAWYSRPRHRRAPERSCPLRLPARAAARQADARARVPVTRSRSPIPTIPRYGWRPPRPRAASAPGTTAPAAATAPGYHGAGNDLKRLAYPHCASASVLRHRRSMVLREDARVCGPRAPRHRATEPVGRLDRAVDDVTTVYKTVRHARDHHRQGPPGVGLCALGERVRPILWSRHGLAAVHSGQQPDGREPGPPDSSRLSGGWVPDSAFGMLVPGLHMAARTSGRVAVVASAGGDDRGPE
jgi:hypothetical protein